MSISAQAAINAALLQLGAFDPGEGPNTSESNACLLVANETLANWYNEQAQSLAILLQEQDKAGTIMIADQVRAFVPLQTSYVLAAGSYTPPTYTNGSYTPAAAPQFADLTTPITLPEGYDLALVLNLAVKLGPQYPSGVVSDTLLKNASDAWAAANPVPGRVPIPGTGFQGTVPAPGAGA